MTLLKDKVAIVTGSTGGLGRAIAIQLAAQGAKVVVNGRDAATGAKVVRQIRDSGGEAMFVQADMLFKEQARALVDAALQGFGQVDIMVASAGAAHPDSGRERHISGLFTTVDPDDVAEHLARSTLVKINPVKAVVDHMIGRQSGSILFITSEGGRFPTPGQTALSLHAAGLMMMCKVIAKELSRSSIRVNTLSVTMVEDTPAWERYTGIGMGAQGKRVFDKIAAKAPFGFAKPRDIAGIATFLVSEEARFITGATVSATGGVTY